MTEEQFQMASEKVKKYSEIQNYIERLAFEKRYVNRGIIQIVSRDGPGYRWEVDCCKRHEGFSIGLTDVILKFYDSEIERLQKQLEEL